MRKARGFTLIEILVTVAIVAILAAIAVPNYSRYVTRGKLVQAGDELSSFRSRMEQYFQDNRTYLAPGGGCGVAEPADRSDAYFTYGCAATATTYTWTATSKSNVTSTVGDFVYTIDQGGNKGTGKAFGTVPAGDKKNTWVTQ